MTAPRLEAIAVFNDPERLEEAVSELQSHGVDRAELSFLTHEGQTPPQDAALSREAVVTDTDLRQGRVLGTGLAATIAAFAATGFTVATGGVAAAVIAAAAAAGGIGVVSTMIGRGLARDEQSFLDAQLRRGGVLLFVRIPDADIERRALEVLRRHSTHVHLHELTEEQEGLG